MGCGDSQGVRLSFRHQTDATDVRFALDAMAMRAGMIAIKAPDNAIDVCGTGGDGLHTLNVSTAVARCDVPPAKCAHR